MPSCPTGACATQLAGKTQGIGSAIIILMSNPNTLLELIGGAPADSTAIVLPEAGIRVTYKQLRDQVTQMADALASLGITRGDRVATYLPNGLPAIVSFLAASVAGTAAPLNPGYREDEVSFYLEDTSAKLLLCPADATAARKAAETRGVPVYPLEMDSAGWVSIGGAPQGKTSSLPSPDDIALILHTSGSTGRPKRVPIMHRNMASSAHNIVAHYGLAPEDVSLCVMPLFHVHGLVASTLSTLLSGGRVVVPGKFSPLSFWRTVRDTGASWYSAVPTIRQFLLLARAGDDLGRRALKASASFVRAAASLPPEMMEADGCASSAFRCSKLTGMTVKRRTRCRQIPDLRAALQARLGAGPLERALRSALWMRRAICFRPAIAEKW